MQSCLLSTNKPNEQDQSTRLFLIDVRLKVLGHQGNNKLQEISFSFLKFYQWINNTGLQKYDFNADDSFNMQNIHTVLLMQVTKN
jgi:hypothetical protein